MHPRVLRLGACLLGASVLLLLLGSLLSSAVPVRSSSSPVNTLVRSGVITDTRWLELIRSGAPGPQLNRTAAAPPTLNLQLMDNLIAGRASSPALITIAAWRNNNLIVSVSATPFPDGESYFYAVQLYPQYTLQGGGGGGYSILQSGDVISLAQGSVSFTMTVPALSARIEAQTDRVSGSAPVSGVVTTYLYSFANAAGPYTRTVSVDAGGHYQANYAGTLDVRPRDSGYAAYSAAPGRATFVRCVAPFLRAQVGGPEISGLAAPLSTVMITVADAAGQRYATWSDYTAPDGSFGLYANYFGIKLKPTDRITATSAGQTFFMTMLTLTAHTDLANHLVRGDAPAQQAVEVQRFDGPLCCSSNSFWKDLPAEQAAVTATVRGQFTAALALSRPNYGAAIFTTPDGNQVYARFAVPYLAARLGTYDYRAPYPLTGQVNEVAAPVTITIQGPSGYFKDVQSTAAASDGYFADYASSGLTLDTGDVITVTTAHGVQAALALPELTGQIDPVTDRVFGTAPPHARLTVTVYYYDPLVVAPPTPAPTATPYYGGGGSSATVVVPPTPAPTATPYYGGGGGPPTKAYTVSVTATAQGDYVVDLHGVIDLDNYSVGNVSLTTAEGHAVTRGLSLSRRAGCDYQIQRIYIGSNQVDLNLAKQCEPYPTGRVRLRAANGQLKNEQPLPTFWWEPYRYFSVYFQAGTRPIPIAPGDIVEVAWDDLAGHQLITSAVPALTVQLDPATNIIRGQAPPNTTVTLNLYRDVLQLRVLTATVTAQGFYTAGLANDIALEAGDTAYAIDIPGTPTAFVAVGVLPVLRVRLYQTLLDGVLPPLAAYTVTLQTTPPFTPSIQGIARSNGYFYAWLPAIKPGDTVVVTTPQRILRLNVPALTAHVDQASATIRGQAPPFARLRAGPYGIYGGSISQNVTATASGVYSVSFPSLAPLNTTYGALTYFDQKGNQAILYFATVHWEVTVNNNCLAGIVDAGGTPVTLTLRASTGSIKSSVLFTPTYTSYEKCFASAIRSGDRLSLQTTLATEVFTVPLLTARHNYALQAVEGAAPPNHELFAEFPWAGGGIRRVFSDSGSRYGVDTSGGYPPLLSRGRIYLRDEAGNTTSIYFTVTGYQAFLPIIRR